MAQLTRLHEEHEQLKLDLQTVRETADPMHLASLEPLMVKLEGISEFLQGRVIPHARAEEETLYRAYARLAGADWAAEAMKQDHACVEQYAQDLESAQVGLFLEAITMEQANELSRILYGLYAVLDLHFAKEEELLLPRLSHALTQEEADALLDEMDAWAAGHARITAS